MSALPILIQQLTSAAAPDADARAEEAAQAAVYALAAHGKEGFSALLPSLSAHDPGLRWWAVRACAEFDLAEAFQALLRALADPDASVRQCAALGLAHRPLPDAVSALLAALGDRDSLVARLAGNALVAIGSPAVEPLLAILENNHDPQRLEAGRALALIGDPRAVPALFGALDGDSLLLDYWANEGLERLRIGMIFYNP